MSSYLVSKLHLDALISAGRTWGLTEGPRHADLIGLVLWQENAAACPEIDRPQEYVNEWLPGEPEPVQVLRWVHTFVYQAASSPSWDGSAAQRWVRELEAEAAHREVLAWTGYTVSPDAEVPMVVKSYKYSNARPALAGYDRESFTWK